MTLVDYNTGEIVDYDRAAAERRAERITMRLDAIAENYSRVLPMIREAVEKRDDIALGYPSPGAYVSDRFGNALANLGLDVRRAVVAELTEAGMSTRAIAPVVGVSQSTVRDDQQVSRSTHLDQTPEPTDVGEAKAGSGQAPEGEGSPGGGAPVEHAAGQRMTPALPPPVTGLDGKTYSRPNPIPKPVLDGDAAEYDNAEQASKHLARAIAKLLEFEHPNMRAGMRRYWDMASVEVPPTQRADVTSEQMRVAAHGLLTLADEWNR